MVCTAESSIPSETSTYMALETLEKKQSVKRRHSSDFGLLVEKTRGGRKPVDHASHTVDENTCKDEALALPAVNLMSWSWKKMALCNDC